VKNTMATVIAMARLTLRQSPDLETFEHAFMNRLQALAEAHSLVFQANWGETDLRQVVERAIAPFVRSEDGRLSVTGGIVKLPPKFALTLTLMMHELATNASKYGALKGSAGRVDVAWALQPGPPALVHLRWVESGGPPVRPPTRKGFGHSLIERGARYELDGEAELSFPEDGMTAELTFPVSRGD
jgi:two-component sensor histidine kinase